MIGLNDTKFWLQSMALSRERRAELSLPPPSKEGPSQNPSQPLRKRPAPDDSDGGEEGTQPPAKKPARGESYTPLQTVYMHQEGSAYSMNMLGDSRYHILRVSVPS